MLGGWEITLILAVVLLLFGAKYWPPFLNGLQRGTREFKKATDDVGHDLGESVGGIAGRPVADALTISNQTAEDTAYPSLDFDAWVKTSWNKFIVWLAQGFGVGRIPLAPGTWGSLVGLGWFCLLTLSGDFRLLLSGTIISVSVAVWVCGNAERILGRQDPPSVVLDEIVAVPLCFFFWAADAWARAGSLPTAGQFFADNWLTVIGVFAAFRFFDVLKPWPIRQSQRLPGGWGIVIDDVLAAVYVNLVMLAALAIFGR